MTTIKTGGIVAIRTIIGSTIVAIPPTALVNILVTTAREEGRGVRIMPGGPGLTPGENQGHTPESARDHIQGEGQGHIQGEGQGHTPEGNLDRLHVQYLTLGHHQKQILILQKYSGNHLWLLEILPSFLMLKMI